MFFFVWDEMYSDDGYVSFELDFFFEDVEFGLDRNEDWVVCYVELGIKWLIGYWNWMIKVLVIIVGLGVLEEFVVWGVLFNVMFIFFVW